MPQNLLSDPWTGRSQPPRRELTARPCHIHSYRIAPLQPCGGRFVFTPRQDLLSRRAPDSLMSFSSCFPSSYRCFFSVLRRWIDLRTERGDRSEAGVAESRPPRARYGSFLVILHVVTCYLRTWCGMLVRLWFLVIRGCSRTRCCLHIRLHVDYPTLASIPNLSIAFPGLALLTWFLFILPYLAFYISDVSILLVCSLTWHPIIISYPVSRFSNIPSWPLREISFLMQFLASIQSCIITSGD